GPHEPVSAAAPRAGAVTPKPTIRVELDRVDRLIDRVGELVTNQARLTQRVLDSGMPRSSGLSSGLDDIGQLARAIQDSAMTIRAQPVRAVFQRMPRLVRELAGMTGKQVRLVAEGEATEVDRVVIERLANPLTHMIRNAIDHGLEHRAVRLAAGKPAEGTVRIAARHRSGRVVIEVADDGAGINRGRVRASAVAKGLVAADAVLSEDDVDRLIFLPGLSTADAVSEISGRGVGLDVVRRSVEGMGGRISIRSRPGLGSTFTLTLPLTPTVLDGMVVTVQGQTLVVPLTAIIEGMPTRGADMHSLAGGARMIAIRGSFVPLVDTGAALGFDPGTSPAPGSVALLVEAEDGSRAALLVASLEGPLQVVIKSLGSDTPPMPGVAAAAILGDGRLAMVLDVDAVIAAWRSAPVPIQAVPARAHDEGSLALGQPYMRESAECPPQHRSGY
ncbi:MAG: chemotaxis protein CheA, partial [Gemmatimonadaceae bacterium]|nr:chemotaxis protein CheA [Acetobacteraceae bacterium]